MMPSSGRNTRFFACFLWQLLAVNVACASETTYYWPKTPLQIDLAVGEEQHISIPSATTLRLGIPPTVKSKLQVEIIGNHLWLKAVDTLSTTRLVVMANPTGRIILEVRAQHSERFNQPMVILAESAETRREKPFAQTKYGFVQLTRWVVQQHYAPKRLLHELPGVQRLSVDPNPLEIFRCALRIPTPCAGAVTSTPMSSWQSPHHFITTIKISNNLTQQLILDPRELRGNWRSAAFVHTQLHAKGHPGDTTLLILISDLPFETANF